MGVGRGALWSDEVHPLFLCPHTCNKRLLSAASAWAEDGIGGVNEWLLNRVANTPVCSSPICTAWALPSWWLSLIPHRVSSSELSRSEHQWVISAGDSGGWKRNQTQSYTEKPPSTLQTIYAGGCKKTWYYPWDVFQVTQSNWGWTASSLPQHHFKLIPECQKHVVFTIHDWPPLSCPFQVNMSNVKSSFASKYK